MSDSRIPQLDGWRGIAILLVLVSHLMRWCCPWAFKIGGRGVGIFFVLSGYLITSRLLRENECSARISLRRFYIKRFFRLMPCAWLYLIFLAVLGVLQPLEMAGCLFFFRGALPSTPTHILTGHFWSLSIEEDFYLLWPSILVFVGKRHALFVATLGSIMLGLCGGIALAFFRPAIMVGCVAALIPSVRFRFMNAALTAALFFMIACMWFTQGEAPTLLESAAVGFLIWSTASQPPRRIFKALSWAPLVWLGTLSYSVYIWQQPFCFLGAQTIASIPARLAGILLLACCSYYFVERPCISYGAYLTDAKSAKPISATVKV